MENPFHSHQDRKYVHWGITALSVILVSALFVAIILNLGACLNGVKKILSILAPILYGLVIAYVLNPLMKRIEQFVRWLMAKKKGKPFKPETVKKTCRVTGVIVSILVLIGIVYALVAMLLPQLENSVVNIFSNMSGYYKTIMRLIDRLTEAHPELTDYLNTTADSIYKSIRSFISEKLLGSVSSVMSTLTSSVRTVITFVLNILIGLILAVYLLYSKESFLAKTKKLLAGLFNEKHTDRILQVSRRANRVFGGFIIGKLVDSAIMAVLCYVCMLIFRLPYPALVATIVGVTNIIPFFGPIIGAVPSAFLIFLTSPIQGLYFIILVLVLQQLDGNVIGPRILGNATGLSGFWVVVAITVFGDVFGFAGMVLGVPVFALLYTLLAERIEERLKARDLPQHSSQFLDMQTVGELKGVPDRPDPEKPEKKKGSVMVRLAEYLKARKRSQTKK